MFVSGDGRRYQKQHSPQRSNVELSLSKIGSFREPEAKKKNAIEIADGALGAVQQNHIHTEYKVYRKRYLFLGILMLQNVMISWAWLTYAPISTAAQEHFDLDSKTPINWLSTVFFLTYAAATPFVIYVLHAHTLKLGMIISASIALAGYWIRYGGAKIGGNTGFKVTMLGQILLGFAQPFVLSAPTYFSDLWFTSKGRVSATALASLSNPFGAALGQLITPIVAERPDQLHMAVLIVSIVGSLACLACFTFQSKPPTPPCPSSGAEKLHLKQAIKPLLKNYNFWAVFGMFVVYLGLFNAFSTLINQILEPYGFSDVNAGISGAILIVVGLVGSAIVSPIVDRTHSFNLVIKVMVPIIGACYLIYLFLPPTRSFPAVCLISGVLGAASFSLLPLALEFVVEQTHPAHPSLTSSLLWVGGQLCGAIFLTAMDALKASGSDEPPFNMDQSLIFQAVLACAVVPFAFCIKDHTNRRIAMDK